MPTSFRLPQFSFDTPDHELDTAPAHGDKLLLWLARRQWRTLLGGVLMGVPWMIAIALQPAAIGGAIDHGIVARDLPGLLLWTGAIAGLGLAIGLLATARHYFAVRNWLHAAFRASLVADHGARRAGPALTRDLPAGEVLTVFTTDFGRMGATFDVTARFSGALVSFVVVAVILLRASTTLGLVLLLGGPLLISSLTLVMRALGRRQEDQRAEFGAMSALGADTVAGLRVLRGIGGEDEFLRRYAVQSARVRASGVRLAGVQALLEAAQVLLPGVFIVIVVGLGAHLALRGEITPGQLVAFFGYTAFLTMPLRTAVEFVEKLSSTRVASRRVARILAVAPDHAEVPAGVAAGSRAMNPTRVDSMLRGIDEVSDLNISGVLRDPESGTEVRAGRFTALVSERPEDTTAILERLGRTAPGRHGVTWDGVAIDDLPLSAVRRTALVGEAHPALFSGRLRDELLGWDTTAARAPDTEGEPGRPGLGEGGASDEAGGPDQAEDTRLLAALDVADAADVLDALPDGLDTELEERGRSLSGGQRQRIVLARSIVADPPVLLLVEPTSAVDAHTEARIISRLVAARSGSGRTTVVTSVSPLVLTAADEVVLIRDGRASARGMHAELLAGSPAYRAVVTREETE